LPLLTVLFFVLLINSPNAASACTNTWTGGSCVGSITYSTPITLANNINASGIITIDSGTTLSTNGFSIITAGNFINLGTITTGPTRGAAGAIGNGLHGATGASVSNSFGGSGGGGGGDTTNTTQPSGGPGGATTSAGGAGATARSGPGSPGATGVPNPPTVNNANIIAWYHLGFPTKFAGAGGGAGGGLSGTYPGGNGGAGANSIYIQAANIIAGTINANGLAGLESTSGSAPEDPGGGGGGGGAIVLLAYGSATAPSITGINTIGGSGFPPTSGGAGGKGGNGNVILFNYVNQPLATMVPPTATLLTPSNVVLDSGQYVTYNVLITSSPNTGPYTVNVVASNGLVMNTIITSSTGTFTVTFKSFVPAAGSDSFNVIAFDAGSGTTFTSPSNIITVNSALVASAAPTPTSPSIDNGQSVTLSIFALTTGTSPYTYEWFSSSTTTCNSGSTDTGKSTASNTFTPSANTYYCVRETDSATTPNVVFTPTDLITVYTTPTLTSLTPSNVLLNLGQSVTYNVILANGKGPFTVNLINTGTSLVVNSLTGQSAGTLTFAANIPAAGSQTFNVVATDTGTTTPFVFSSLSNTIKVNSALTAPSAPTILSNQIVDQGQTPTLTGTIPSTGTSTYSWQWLYSTNGGSSYSSATSSQCATPSGAGAAAGATETCSFATTGSTTTGNYLFELRVTDSASTSVTITSTASPIVTVNPTLTAPAAPILSSNAIDNTQQETITGNIPSTGTAPYFYNWLTSIDGGSYGDSTQCTVNSGSGQAANTVENCVIPANTISAGDTYIFELQIKDSATLPEIVTSTASNTLTVSQTVTPGMPTVSDTRLDVNDGLEVTGLIPSNGVAPYSYNWLISTNGLSYVVTTQCTVNSGSGQAANTLETCNIPGGVLTVGDVYTFELQVTDSLGATTNSIPSSSVSVASQLTTPSTPTVVLPILDNDQVETINGIMPSTGTSPYSYTWLRSVNGGPYAAATRCNQPSGTGQASGNVVSCIVLPSNAFPVGSPFNFELQVTDGSTTSETAASAASVNVLVSSALTAPAAPTTSAQSLDSDQPETVNGIMPSTGSSPYSYTWLVSVNGGSYATASQCTSASGSGQISGNTVSCIVPASTLASGHTYLFELKVTDSATLPESATSSASGNIVVATPLATPSITPSSTQTLDSGQTVTFNSLWSGGSAPYTANLYASSGSTCNNANTLVQSIANIGATDVIFAANTPSATSWYCIYVTDSSFPSETTFSPTIKVMVNPALTSASTPTVANTVLDQGQLSTITGAIPSTGTGQYSYGWLVKVPGSGVFVAANSLICAQPSGTAQNAGNTVSCNLATTGSTTTGNYLFELQVTDSAPVPETTISSSNTVVLNSALTEPATPTVSLTALDVNQAETVTGTIPSTGSSPYSYTWLVSVNGASYVTATQCTANTGSNQNPGNTITCSINGGTLTVTDTYNFKLQVVDSASNPTTANSAASSTITVSSQLTAPLAPSISAPKLDVNQAETVTATIPTTGTTPYSYVWLVSTDGGAYTTSTLCTVNSGSNQNAGNTVTCSIPGGTLTVAATYNFELQVRDAASVLETTTSPVSGTVNVESQLTAPASPLISDASLDADQVETVTGTIPSTGSSQYSYTWLVSVNGASYVTASQCTSNTGSNQNAGNTITCSINGGTLTATDTYNFKLQVSDGATVAETVISSPSSIVIVHTALVSPSAPSVSATKLDVDQPETATGTIPSTGIGPYSYSWLISVNGASYTSATQCNVATGTNQNAGNTVTCNIPANTLTIGNTYNFELQVTDSASTPDTVASAQSATVVVASQLITPTTPSVSATALDVDQPETVNGIIPSTGSSQYSYTWLVSINGASYVTATQCVANTGSNQNAGAVITCSINGGTLTIGNTYNFELRVSDGATVPEATTSAASSMVTVASQLTAPSTPSLSANIINVGQSETITSTLPSSGTQPYTYTWHISANGGAYSTATQCTQPTGSNQNAGTVITCSIPGNTLASGNNYNFELEIADSASVAELIEAGTANDPASNTLIVTSTANALEPAVSSPSIDVDQIEILTGVIPSNPLVEPYTYTWLVSINGGLPYATATQCGGSATGSNQNAGNTVICTIPIDTLTAASTYSFELQVTDTTSTATNSMPSNTVMVYSALTTSSTPSISASILDNDQVETITSILPSTGAPPYTYTWHISKNGGAFSTATQCTQPTGSGQPTGGTVTCTIPVATLDAGNSYNFALEIADSSTTPESAFSSSSSTVTVSSPLTAPSAPSISEASLDADQAETVTGTIPSTGSSQYSYTWLVSVNSASYVTATQCVANTGSNQNVGATVTCSINAGTLTATDAYNFKLQVSDGATVAETTMSSPSSTVTVNTALVSPSAPSVSATKLDVDQPETATGTIPSTGIGPYSYSWLVSVNGASYTSATQCNVATGTNQNAGNTVTCNIPANTLTIGNTYNFELQVTDSASTPDTVTSAQSATVVVASQLTSSPSPSVLLPALDRNQAETVTGTIPSTGSSTYTYYWLVSINGGSYSVATQCTTNTATGVIAGNTVECNMPSSTLTTASTYDFRLQVLDGANAPETITTGTSPTITVSPVLGSPSTPTLSGNALDSDQAETVTGTIPTGGTPTDSYDWLVSDNGGAYIVATQCTIFSGANQIAGNTVVCVKPGNVLSAGHTYSFELQVTDSATSPETQSSAPSQNIVVSSPLISPGQPTISASKLVVNQIETVTGIIPSTGLSPYTYNWLVSVNGGSYTIASVCVAASGSNQNAGGTVMCNIPANTLTIGDTYDFELQVSDGSSSPETANSVASANVMVHSILTPPTTPTLSLPLIDPDDPVTVTSTLPSTAFPPYSYIWLTSISGGTYATATQCTTNTGSGQLAGNTVTCNIPGGTLQDGDTYNFELEISGSATTPETQSSLPSNTLGVTSELTAPTPPTVSTTALVIGQQVLITLNVVGGVPPYSYNFLISDATTNVIIASSGNQVTSLTDNSFAYTTSLTGTLHANVIVMESDYDYTIVNSTYSVPFTVTLSGGTGGGGGGGGGSGGGTGGSGGGGGGGGPAGPSISQISNNSQSGYAISNISQLNTFSIDLCGQEVQITDNFITPNTTGISIRATSYILSPGQLVSLVGVPGCYITLKNVTYTPILDTVQLLVYAPYKLNLVLNGQLVLIKNITIGAPITLTVPGLPLSLNFEPTQSTNVLVANELLNGTIPPLPNGYTKLGIFDITLRNLSTNGAINSPVMTTLNYGCNVSEARLQPFLLGNGVWVKINPFSVNPAACTISFNIPSDPIIAFGVLPPGATTVPSTTTISQPSLATTTVPSITPPTLPPIVGNNIQSISVLLIALVLLLLLLLVMKKRGDTLRTWLRGLPDGYSVSGANETTTQLNAKNVTVVLVNEKAMSENDDVIQTVALAKQQRIKITTFASGTHEGEILASRGGVGGILAQKVKAG
jgi:hypothetical protein